MNLPDLVIVALIEGVAEVLPIDASGHALLVSRLLGWRAGSISIAIHLATALALLLYLWRDVLAIGNGLWKLRKGRVEPGTRLLVKALLAALPWVVLTSLLGDPAIPRLTDLVPVGLATVVCAVIMLMIDRRCMTVKRIEHIGALTALSVGLAQMLAFFPGVGRLAAGLTTARLLGVERPAAFRFVLLVSVPLLLAQAGQEGVGSYIRGIRPATGDSLVFIITFLLVLLAVSLGTGWIKKSGLIPFALYRLVIGAALVALGLL